MQRFPHSEHVTRSGLRRAYGLMRDRFGHQNWWPAETAFEVCVGAILTQNTSWFNVERALARLRSTVGLDPAALAALPEPQLAELIRPSGYYRVKARRLGQFLHALMETWNGQLDRMLEGDTVSTRARLLAISGIGPETADCMLLYAGGQPVFVVDAYTRRVFSRHGWCEPRATYQELQALCTRHLSHTPAARQLDYWQDYHAQLVMVGKHYCGGRRALCEDCPLQSLLPQFDVDRGPRLSYGPVRAKSQKP